MTGEEMERAIEFILQNQATFEERLSRTNERIEQVNRDLGKRIAETQQQLAGTQQQLAETLQQLAETNRMVQMHAGTQTEFIKVVTQALGDLADAQRRDAEAHRLSAESQRRINEALVEVQRRTDDRVDRLAATVERFISEGRDGRA